MDGSEDDISFFSLAVATKQGLPKPVTPSRSVRIFDQLLPRQEVSAHEDEWRPSDDFLMTDDFPIDCHIRHEISATNEIICLDEETDVTDCSVMNNTIYLSGDECVASPIREHERDLILADRPSGNELDPSILDLTVNLSDSRLSDDMADMSAPVLSEDNSEILLCGVGYEPIAATTSDVVDISDDVLSEEYHVDHTMEHDVEPDADAEQEEEEEITLIDLNLFGSEETFRLGNDENGFAFIDLANQHLTHFHQAAEILSKAFAYNDSPPPHPPLHSFPHSYAYLFPASYSVDSTDYYSDTLPYWCIEGDRPRTRKAAVDLRDGELKMSKDGASTMVQYSSVSKKMKTEKRVFFVCSTNEKNEKKLHGNVLIFYHVGSCHEGVSLKPFLRPTRESKLQATRLMEQRLMSTRSVSNTDSSLPLNTIRYLRRNPEVLKHPRGRVARTDWEEVEKMEIENNFVKKHIGDGVNRSYLLFNDTLLEMWLSDLPTRSDVMNEQRRIDAILASGGDGMYSGGHVEIERRKGIIEVDTTYDMSDFFVTPIVILSSQILNVEGKKPSSFIPVYLVSKKTPITEDFEWIGIELSREARRRGYEGRCVRAFVTDADAVFTGLMKGDLFNRMAHLRCTRHIQSNLEAAFPKNSQAISMFKLVFGANQGSQSRSAGFLDETTLTGALRRFQGYPKTGFDRNLVKWFNERFAEYYHKCGVVARLLAGWGLRLADTNLAESRNKWLKEDEGKKLPLQSLLRNLREKSEGIVRDLECSISGTGSFQLPEKYRMPLHRWLSLSFEDKKKHVHKIGMETMVARQETVPYARLFFGGRTGAPLVHFQRVVESLTVARIEGSEGAELCVSSHDSCVKVNVTEGRFVCQRKDCRLLLNFCSHKVACLIYCWRNEGENAIKEEIEALDAMSMPDLRKMVSGPKDGLKPGTRKGSAYSNRNHSRELTHLLPSVSCPSMSANSVWRRDPGERENTILASYKVFLPSSREMEMFILPAKYLNTLPFHNRKPFVIHLANDTTINGPFVRRSKCVSCGGELHLGQLEHSPNDIVLCHSERFPFPDRITGATVYSTSAERIGLIHSRLSCLVTRYPYARRDSITMSEAFAENASNFARLWVEKSFGIMLPK